MIGREKGEDVSGVYPESGEVSNIPGCEGQGVCGAGTSGSSDRNGKSSVGGDWKDSPVRGVFCDSA